MSERLYNEIELPPTWPSREMDFHYTAFAGDGTSHGYHAGGLKNV